MTRSPIVRARFLRETVAALYLSLAAIALSCVRSSHESHYLPRDVQAASASPLSQPYHFHRSAKPVSAWSPNARFLALSSAFGVNSIVVLDTYTWTTTRIIMRASIGLIAWDADSNGIICLSSGPGTRITVDRYGLAGDSRRVLDADSGGDSDPKYFEVSKNGMAILIHFTRAGSRVGSSETQLEAIAMFQLGQNGSDIVWRREVPNGSIAALVPSSIFDDAPAHRHPLPTISIAEPSGGISGEFKPEASIYTVVPGSRRLDPICRIPGIILSLKWSSAPAALAILSSSGRQGGSTLSVINTEGVATPRIVAEFTDTQVEDFCWRPDPLAGIYLLTQSSLELSARRLFHVATAVKRTTEIRMPIVETSQESSELSAVSMVTARTRPLSFAWICTDSKGREKITVFLYNGTKVIANEVVL